MSLIENQRIVVLGAAGFIGFHLSLELSKIKGISLVIVDTTLGVQRTLPIKVYQ